MEGKFEEVSSHSSKLCVFPLGQTPVTYQESNHGDLLKPLDFSRSFSDNPKQSELCSGKIFSPKESQVISGETHCE